MDQQGATKRHFSPISNGKKASTGINNKAALVVSLMMVEMLDVGPRDLNSTSCPATKSTACPSPEATAQDSYEENWESCFLTFRVSRLKGHVEMWEAN